MSFNVSTAVFEGPLDLLLQLITRHQVDIAEVSLTGRRRGVSGLPRGDA